MFFKKFYIIYISFLLILIKWFFSFYFFQEEIDVRVLFESVADGKYYFPLIKFLSDLNFNLSFDPNIENLKIVPIPISSLFFHSIFFRLSNFYSFIFLEFISLTTFIFLLYKINCFVFPKKISLIYSLLILCLPAIINLSFLNEIQYLKVFSDNIYNFRVPRPMVSNLFLLSFVYLILKTFIKNSYTVKNFLLIGLVLGLSLSSFYYHFILESLVLMLILILKYKFNFIKNIFFKFKYYLYLISSFLITSLPFLINLYFHEKDFTNRQCVYSLTLENKEILLKFYLKQFTEIGFIILFFGVVFSSIWLNFKNNKNKKFINLFCILFVSSVLSPLFFIIVSNKSCVFYHFNNLIIITGILYFIFFTFVYLESLLKNALNNKLYKAINIFLIFFISITFYLPHLNKFTDINYKDSRIEFNKITKTIKNIDEIKNVSILTFDSDFMIWAMMNDVKYLTLINGLFSSKKDEMIEKDIFSAFKILGLDIDNFNKFIDNKNDKSSWRYLNNNISTFFFYKYQANSMIVYRDMQEFTENELKFIKKSSPILHQQSIVPQMELERLRSEFINFNDSILKPNFLILNINNNFYDITKLKLIDYCIEYQGTNYILFKQKKKYKCKKKDSH